MTQHACWSEACLASIGLSVLQDFQKMQANPNRSFKRDQLIENKTAMIESDMITRVLYTDLNTCSTVAKYHLINGYGLDNDALENENHCKDAKSLVSYLDTILACKMMIADSNTSLFYQDISLLQGRIKHCQNMISKLALPKSLFTKITEAWRDEKQLNKAEGDEKYRKKIFNTVSKLKENIYQNNKSVFYPKNNNDNKSNHNIGSSIVHSMSNSDNAQQMVTRKFS